MRKLTSIFPYKKNNNNIIVTDPPPTGAPLSISASGVLLYNGVPYRAIGVDYYDAFYRYVINGDTSYRAGLAALQSASIPFIRCLFMPFWPNDAKPYVPNNTAALLELFDTFVADAAKYNIGLIPSVFWNYPTIPNLFGEPVSAWGNPTSQTTAFNKSFSQTLAARYANSPVIWAWEFSNEMNDWEDFSTGYQYYPIDTSSGTPASYTAADNYTSEQLLFAYQTFATAIHAGDPNRLVEPGYDRTRFNAYNSTNGGSGAEDTEAQSMSAFTRDNAPGQLCSVHNYPEDYTGALAQFANVSINEVTIIPIFANTAQADGRPLFMGEFSVTDDGGGPTGAAFATLTSMVNAFVASVAPLACMWVYDFTFQNGTYNMGFAGTTTGARLVERLNLITATNQKLGVPAP